jgi:hypothetical protein
MPYLPDLLGDQPSRLVLMFSHPRMILDLFKIHSLPWIFCQETANEIDHVFG